MSDAGAPPSCFPTEVYEEIIQWVPLGIRLPSKKSVEDHPEIRLSCLCSCALTCRAWLPASRACLYKSISFLSDDKTSLERFVRSLDTNPWLGTLVVYLNVYDLFPRRQAALLPPPRDTILTTWAPMLAGKLPSLHTLQVGFVDHLSRHLLFIKCMRSFSAITTLVLDLSYLPTFADLLRFLTSFPKLQTVSSTRAIQWPVRGSIPPMRPDRFPAISRLFLRMILLPTSLGKRHVAHMLLNITRDSVRVLGIRSTFGCPSPIDEPIVAAYTLPSLQTLHYTNYPPSRTQLMSRNESQYKYVADWAFRSAPVLKNIVFHFPPLARQARMKCRFVRSSIKTLVGVHLAYNILPHLPRTATRVTLLLCDEYPRGIKRQQVLATTAIVCVREMIARIKRCPATNVVWCGLTEGSKRLFLTATEHDEKALTMSYLPPPEIAGCLEEHYWPRASFILRFG